MIWYAHTPGRRARQIAADLLMVLWLLACIAIGRAVHAAVQQLARPAYGLRDASARVDDGLVQSRDRLTDVPLVGDRLRGVFDPLTGATGDVGRATTDFIAAVDRLALLTALVTAVLPLLAALVPWLWLRVSFARRAAAVRRLADASGGLDLFALRALTRLPAPALARIDPNPAAAWRRGDEDVVRRLAAAELAAAGVRPRPAGARPVSGPAVSGPGGAG